MHVSLLTFVAGDDCFTGFTCKCCKYIPPFFKIQNICPEEDFLACMLNIFSLIIIPFLNLEYFFIEKFVCKQNIKIKTRVGNKFSSTPSIFFLSFIFQHICLIYFIFLLITYLIIRKQCQYAHRKRIGCYWNVTKIKHRGHYCITAPPRFQLNPVGLGCRIRRLHLCREVRPPQTSVLYTATNHLMLRLQSWSFEKCGVAFDPIYPTPPLGQDMTQGNFFKRSLAGLNSEFSFS